MTAPLNPLRFGLFVAAVASVCTALVTWLVVRPRGPAPEPPPVPATIPADWQGLHDTDKVPVQVVTLTDGHAWFVVGTDTVDWQPRVWLYSPETKKWEEQR